MDRISVESPFGILVVSAERGVIVGLGWGMAVKSEDPLLREAARQLGAYCEGKLERFDLPLRVTGTAFQRSVCERMCEIPFGETRTYGEIAQSLGASARAVGSACGANPIAIIIPCHRVVGKRGLTGYSGVGGVATKVALLRHERAGGLLL